VKAYDFPTIHYWRPLLPANTKPDQIRHVLDFVSSIADASVIVGLKLHPALTSVLRYDGGLAIPDHLIDSHGEWLESDVIDTVYAEARQRCPDYPLYRHTSCALSRVLSRPNHTATVFRNDICPPSHCPTVQRAICRGSQAAPSDDQIVSALSDVGIEPVFSRHSDHIRIEESVDQEQFSYLLHSLNFPLRVKSISFTNLYRGDIHKGQDAMPPG
jgi:hypothetical protein